MAQFGSICSTIPFPLSRLLNTANRAKQTLGSFFLGLAARLTESVPVMLKTLLGIGTNEPLAGRDYTDDRSPCQVITIRRWVISHVDKDGTGHRPGRHKPCAVKRIPRVPQDTNRLVRRLLPKCYPIILETRIGVQRESIRAQETSRLIRRLKPPSTQATLR